MSDRLTWKTDTILLVIMILFGSMSLSGLGLHLLVGTEDAPKMELSIAVKILINAISFHGLIILGAYFLIRQHETTWNEAFGFQKNVSPSINLGVQIGLISTVTLGLMSIGIRLLLEALETEAPTQTAVQAVQEAITQNQASDIWIMGIVSIVVAPIAEEILFRGILFKTLNDQNRTALAWIGTSVFFGLIHGNAPAFLPLTIFSLALTWLYVRTENLLAPITAHVVLNAANFTLMLLQKPA